MSYLLSAMRTSLPFPLPCRLLEIGNKDSIPSKTLSFFSNSREREFIMAAINGTKGAFFHGSCNRRERIGAFRFSSFFNWRKRKFRRTSGALMGLNAMCKRAYVSLLFLSLSRSSYSSPGIILCLLLGKKRRRRKRLKKVGGRDGDDTSTKSIAPLVGLVK